jgi:hypothetical protein
MMPVFTIPEVLPVRPLQLMMPLLLKVPELNERGFNTLLIPLLSKFPPAIAKVPVIFKEDLLMLNNEQLVFNVKTLFNKMLW